MHRRLRGHARGAVIGGVRGRRARGQRAEQRRPDRAADLLAGVHHRRGHAGVARVDTQRRGAHRRGHDQPEAQAHHQKPGKDVARIGGVDRDAREDHQVKRLGRRMPELE